MSVIQFFVGSLRAFSILSVLAALAFFILSRSIYRLYFHPLTHIPGPLLPKLTSLWLHYHAYVGDEASAIHRLHLKYGPIVRVSPREVDISDADAIGPIYISKGGFPKAPCYANFDIDGHSTIFSTISHEYRAVRAKAVTPMFSTKAIRDNVDAIYGCVVRYVDRLKEEAATKRPVNVLNLSRSLAVDVVSTHLFQENYNGTSERGTLSASAFVDAFVAVGRFFYLPTMVFVWLEWAIEKLQSDERTSESMGLVDKFVGNLVEKTSPKSMTYPGRMKAAGLDDSEIRAQCKDLIFAGTDSTGMNLATILRSLVLHPEKYARLRSEITANAALGPDAVDVQALPYLSAVVKEGLRISMANPTRLPHVVPHGGWSLDHTYFPPGTIVGCSAYELHMNPHVFPDPRSFKPERWLESRDEMSKHWFAFGAGPRACIARNLATLELQWATEKVVESDVLKGARATQHEIEILEWFNSKVKDEKIELVWN
ncbi:cytochrome P450 [Clohesyomyces aquaticus]|uniref:Cytochrome P450 n=1 Tax=Clohesyomyces aquaticus TaxID=1231657 RepID=A0A1Y1ZU43_9PLEO|nr:cytochrome P450 [Clohesyomyces aquaticus]